MGEKGMNRKGYGVGRKDRRGRKGNWEKVACGVLRGTSLPHSQLLNSLYLG